MLSSTERPVQNEPQANDQQLKIFEIIKQEVLQRRSDVRRLRHEISELHKRMKDVEDVLKQPAPESEIQEEVSIFGPIKERLQEIKSELKRDTASTELMEETETPAESMDIEPSMTEFPVESMQPEALTVNDGAHDGKEEEHDVIEASSLQERLHEQLKRAEVEMSLERARVFQQKAELEELKIKMQQDKGAENSDSQDHDFETRWNRHLEHYRRKMGQ